MRILTLLALLATAAQAQITIPGTANEEALFGRALATGDFNGDGHDDLAIGAPQEGGTQTPELGVVGGSVTVLYLAPGGQRALDADVIVQGRDGYPNADESGDSFGFALASGDFDGDGYDDLAIGAYTEDIGPVEDAGGVLVVYGSADGLSPARALPLDQNQSAIPGGAESRDLFGYALAAGDLNGDGFDDLAIGISREDLGSIEDAGLVIVILGRSDGLFINSARSYTRSELIGGTDQSGDRLGFALAFGDLNGDGFDELVIGAPTAEVSGVAGAGYVVYVPGSAQGLVQASARRIAKDVTPDATPREFDLFGFALTVGDIDQNGFQDLIVGVPGERVDGAAGAGAVYVYRFTDAALNYQLTVLTQRASLAGSQSEADDGFSRALAVGDLDGDGFPDLAVGAVGKDIGALSTGVVYVLYGSPNASLFRAAERVDLVAASGVEAGSNDYFGSSLAMTGPGTDGRAALVVGASERDFPQVGTYPINDAGAVFVYATTDSGVVVNAPIAVAQGGQFPAFQTASEPGAEAAFALSPPAPNPTRGDAAVGLDVRTPGPATVTLFDALGRRVAVLHAGPLAAGTHRLALSGAPLSPGLYVVRAVVGGEAQTQRLVVAR